jgi:hypothetical protein
MALSRRELLIGALGTGLLAACSSAETGSASRASETPDTGSPTGAPSGPSSPSATAARSAAVQPLPGTGTWMARQGEVEPAVKRRATSLVEAVAAWGGSEGDVASARSRAKAAGHDPALVAGLAALLGDGVDAVVSVRDAQYGGILASAASVLVVVDQWRRGSDGTVTAGGTTLDARLVRATPHWRVVDVLPARPASPAAPSATARRVLADDRIRLPHAALADVEGDSVHDSVLTFLLGLAEAHVVDISVLRSGHPLHVFGTSRTSDHPQGRAVDVWALDHAPLVVPANHRLATDAMRYAVAHGAYNVGGPVALGGRQYFSDRTHRDHIHLGFRS